MRKNLLLIILAFSLVLFFSKLGVAQNNEITLQPVVLNIHPCIGGGTVEIDMMITTVDSQIVSVQVPVFVGGTATPVLNCVLTGGQGGLPCTDPPAGMNPPSLVAAFSSKIVNQLMLNIPPPNPLMFAAIDFGNGINAPSTGLYCKMFFDVAGPGTITIDTGYFSPSGSIGMNDPDGPRTNVFWGGPYTFDVVRTPEQAPVITQPDSLKYFVGDIVTYNFSATDGGGTPIVGTFIKDMVPPALTTPTLSGSNPWTITWNTGTSPEVEGWYAITVGVFDECETTYCTTYVKLTGVVGHIWIGNQLLDVNGGLVDPCDLVKVPVYMIAKADFGAFDLYIEFDPTLLYFQGVEKGPGLPQGWEYFTYRQLPCPMCGCCKYKLQIFGLYDIKDKHAGEIIPNNPNDTLIIAYLNFQVACDQNLRGYDLNICFEFDDGICTENTFSDPTGYFLYVSDNPDFWSYDDCDTQYHGTNTVLNLMNFVLFNPPGTPVKVDGRPCGGVLVRTTAEKQRGDINLNLIAYDPADVVLFSSYFIKGTSVFTIDPPIQIANTDINADGFPLSLSDFVYMLRVMLSDATKYPKPTPGSDLATIYVTQGTVTTNATLGAALLTFKGEGKVSSNLTLEQGIVDGNLRVLVYMNSGAGLTGELLTVSGATLQKVEAVDNFGRPVKVTLVNKVIPTAFALHPNYPNPFNPTTNISFALPIDSKVSLKLYNVAGQLVRTLVNETMPAGNHTVTWDGSNSNGEKVASGIYFYKLNAGDFSKTMKMVMTK
jgi:hypothetical protein